MHCYWICKHSWPSHRCNQPMHYGHESSPLEHRQAIELARAELATTTVSLNLWTRQYPSLHTANMRLLTGARITRDHIGVSLNVYSMSWNWAWIWAGLSRSCVDLGRAFTVIRGTWNGRGMTVESPWIHARFHVCVLLYFKLIVTK